MACLPVHCHSDFVFLCTLTTDSTKAAETLTTRPKQMASTRLALRLPALAALLLICTQLALTADAARDINHLTAAPPTGRMLLSDAEQACEAGCKLPCIALLAGWPICYMGCLTGCEIKYGRR